MKKFLAVMTAAAISVVAMHDPARAQDTTPRIDTAALPHPELTPEQKQMLYTSALNLNMKNESLPNFQAIIGATVPEAIQLEPVPKTVVELAPKIAEFEIARVANQIIVVEPKSRKVVEVIAGEKP